MMVQQERICLQCRRHRILEFISWRRKCQSILVFLPGKSQGQNNLAGYSPQGLTESDTIEWLNTHTIVNDIWHLSMCLLVIGKFSLEKCLLRSSIIFFFFWLSCLFFWYWAVWAPVLFNLPRPIPFVQRWIRF